MQRDTQTSTVPTNLPGHNLPEPGVCFDPEEAILEGVYIDELSAYRAKKGWVKALEVNFLLEDKHDFSIKVIAGTDSKRFQLKCEFESACGRYAFWRLTHNQAPEAQYVIETAHIPDSEKSRDALMGAPDLRSSQYAPSILEDHMWARRERGLRTIILDVLAKIGNRGR